MSNDLISRSDLLKDINNYVFDTVNPDTRRGEHAAKAHICELIEKQPTDYDVDKVVEQLEEIREEILTDTAYDNDTVNHYLEYADLMIEDVKAGGVNE